MELTPDEVSNKKVHLVRKITCDYFFIGFKY